MNRLWIQLSLRWVLLGSLIAVTNACDRTTPAFDEAGAEASAIRIAFSPDGKLIAAGTARNIVQLWDLETRKLRWEFAHPTESNTKAAVVAFAPDGESFVAGYSDGSLIFWSTKTGKALQQAKAHQGEIVRVVFSKDGRYLATECTNDRQPPLEAGKSPLPEAAVWKVDNIERIGLFPFESKKLNQIVAFDDEHHLVVKVEFNRWQRYHVNDDEVKPAEPSDRIRLLNARKAFGRRFSASLRYSVHTEREGLHSPFVALIDDWTEDEYFASSLRDVDSLRPWHVAFGPGENFVVIAGQGWQEVVPGIPAAGGGQIHPAKLAVFQLHPTERTDTIETGADDRLTRIFAVAFSPDGRLVATTGQGRAPTLFEVTKKGRLRPWNP